MVHFPKKAVFYGVIVLVVLGTFSFLKDGSFVKDGDQNLSKEGGPIVDEQTHFDQIDRYVQGTYTWDPRLPQLPGYHILMAALARIYGDWWYWSFKTLRTINLVFGLLSIVVFARILELIHGKVDDNRVMQYVFCPLVLPFFCLNYTEISSLLLVLLGFYCGLQRHYNLSGLALCLSVFIRQNNVIWLMMLPFIFQANEGGFRFDREGLARLVKSYWISLLGLVAFAVFVYLNGGVALGDKWTHPTGKLYSGNLFLMLLIYFLFFLPSILVHLPRLVRFGWGSPYTPLVVAVLFSLYMFNLLVDHHYNQLTGYYLHNTLMKYVTSTVVLRLLFFIPILIAVLDIAANQLQQKVFVLVYPATALFLMPSWLIEARYCMIPVVLLLLFRKEENPGVERITTIMWVIASFLLIRGIQRTEVFL
jgi:alpha-1,2-glucosyltransferase